MMGAFDHLIPGNNGAAAQGRAEEENVFSHLIPTGEAAAVEPARPSFFEDPLGKLSRFGARIYEQPPPTIAAARDIIKGAPAAATELTYGADPEAAREAAGTITGAAMLGLTGAPGTMGGAGVFGAPRPVGARPTPIAAAAAVPSSRDAMLQAAERLDVEVPRFLASEGTAMPAFAGGIKQVPWAGEPLMQSAQQLSGRLGEAKSEIAGAAASPEMAGGQASSALTNWIKSGSRGPEGEAYGVVDKLIKEPESTMPLTNTAEIVQGIIDRRSNARIPGTSKAADIVIDAIKGPMDYEGIKNLRTYVGQLTPMEMTQQGINAQELRAIYGGLTRDLENVIGGAGGPDALRAWQEANALSRLTNMQRAALTRIVGAEGQNAPEQVFAKLATYAGSKSGADIARLRIAKNAMGEKAWQEVGSALINRMGMAPDGTFSPDRFVTAFGNMSAKAKAELFEGDQLTALNDLFTVSKHVQDKITRFGNPSGTGRTIFGLLAGGALFADPISMLVSMAGTRGAAYLLTQPAVVKAATTAARTSLRGNPAATKAALTQLQAVVRRTGATNIAPQTTAEGYPYYQQ
jgi:hypothetical protein